MQKRTAQGTIEYLIIIAIVVVIALVVVGLLTGFFSTGSEIGINQQKIGQQNQTITIQESATSIDGNILLNLGSNETTDLKINKISADGQDQNYYTNNEIGLGEKGLFILSTNTTCTEGSNKIIKELTITYVTKNGITKKQTYENITIPCQNYEVTNTNLLAGTTEIETNTSGTSGTSGSEGDNNNSSGTTNETQYENVNFLKQIPAAGYFPSKTSISSTFADDKNNLFVLGYISSGESAQFGETTISTTAENDLFVAKLLPNGDWNWITTTSNTGDLKVNPRLIQVDSLGDIYVGGDIYTTYYSSSGNYNFEGGTLESSGSIIGNTMDAFIAKLSSSGEWEWVRKTTPTEGVNVYGNAYGLAINNDSVYFGITHGSGTVLLGGSTWNSDTYSRILISKINKDTGNFNWISGFGHQYNGSGSVTLNDLKVSGSIIQITGENSSDSFYIGSDKIESPTSYPVTYIGELLDTGSNASGIWGVGGGNPSGTSSLNYKTTMVNNNSDKLFLIGYAVGSGQFGTDLIGTGSGTTFYAVGEKSGVANGAWIYAKTIQPEESFEITAINNGNTKNPIIAGTIMSGSGTFPGVNTNLNVASGGDFFIAEIDPNGTNGEFLWAKKAGTDNINTITNPSLINSISANNNNIFLTGLFSGTQKFDENFYTSSNNGAGWDLFIWKTNKPN